MINAVVNNFATQMQPLENFRLLETLSQNLIANTNAKFKQNIIKLTTSYKLVYNFWQEVREHKNNAGNIKDYGS